MIDNDDLDEDQEQGEPRRYPLQWEEGIRPDDEELKYETVGDDEQ